MATADSKLNTHVWHWSIETFRQIMNDIMVGWPILAAIVYLMRTPRVERDLVYLANNLCSGIAMLFILLIAVECVVGWMEGD